MRKKIGLIIIIVGISYFLTLPSGTYLEDSGELTAAAYLQGIPHPSGYPLYVLLGKVFSFFPIGSVAFRLSMMSAVFGILTAIFVFLALRELGRILSEKFSKNAEGGNFYNEWLVFLVTLIFVFSRDFWSQAIVAEVYTLNTFFTALMLFLVLRIWKSEGKQLYWLAFLGGLGLTNHLLLGFLLPIFWPVLYLKRPNKFAWKKILTLCGLFVLGSSVYLYLPLRAASDPALNFGDINTVQDSIGHILRTGYQDFDPGIEGRSEFVLAFFRTLGENFTWMLVLVGILGIGTLFLKKEGELWTLLLGSFLASAFFPILLRNLSFSGAGEFLSRVYYFQAYIFFLSFIFLALQMFRKKFLRIGIIISLTVLASFTLVSNFRKVSLADSPVEKYYEQKLESFPEKSVYILVEEGYNNDSELFVLYYLQKVKGIRSDVTILEPLNLFKNYRPDDSVKESKKLADIRRTFAEYAVKNYLDRPVFFSFPVEKYLTGYWSVPSGVAVFATQVKPSGPDWPVSGNKSQGIPAESLKHPRRDWDLAYQDFLAARFYQQALLAQFEGRVEATDYLVQAINTDVEIDSEDLKAFQAFRGALLTNTLK